MEESRPSSKIISQLVPHSYQLELLQYAQQENAIIFLGAGMGKTFIAALLIDYVLREDRARGSSKKVIFIVNQSVVVAQQHAFLSQTIDYPMGQYHSKTNGIDFWDICRWQDEYSHNDIIVITAQTFINNLRHAYIKMADIALLIFDECHHARKSHPYNCIMSEFYFKLSRPDRPKVLGLTGTPIMCGARQLQDKDMVTKMWTSLERSLVRLLFLLM